MKILSVKRGHSLIKFYICVLITFLFLSSSLFFSSASHAATDDWISAKIPDGLTATYGKYHHENIANLPQAFKDYAMTSENFCYYSTRDYHTVYCIEIAEHVFSQNPNESTTPPPNFSDPAKQKLLTYVLLNGQKVWGGDEESIKRQTATQLAVWLIAEELAYDDVALNAVLFPETGDFADTEAFAPTLAVGRMSRALLQEAKDFVASGEEFTDQLSKSVYPSFLSKTEADAQTLTLNPNPSGFYVAEVEDTNKILALDWSTKNLKVLDDGGLHLSVFDDSLRISGNPTQPETLLKFEGPYDGYEVSYLEKPGVNLDGKPYQRMSRFARLNSNTPLFLKVKVAGVGMLTLSKNVTNGGDENKDFSFSATFKDAQNTDVSDVLLNGKAFQSGDTFTLKHGQTAAFTNLPAGTNFQIVESSYSTEGYTSDKANNTVSGTTDATGFAAVNFVNSYSPPGETTPPGGTTPPGTNTPPGNNFGKDSPPPSGKSPYTGDDSTLMPLLIILGIVSLLLVVTCVGLWKQNRNLYALDETLEKQDDSEEEAFDPK